MVICSQNAQITYLFSIQILSRNQELITTLMHRYIILTAQKISILLYKTLTKQIMSKKTNVQITSVQISLN